MDIKELEYQHTLSFDMISFLFIILTLKMTKDEAVTHIDEIFKLWEGRLEQLSSSVIDISTKKAMDSGIEEQEDVMRMIFEIHDTLPKMLRDEFIIKLHNYIIKSIVEIKETQDQQKQ